MRSLTVCAEPGCCELVERGRCATHRLPGKPRPSRGTEAWRRRSLAFRTRNPWCTVCGQRANQVDHVIDRDLLVAAGIHDPDHDRWLQALCLRCHGRKTRIVDDRYGRRLAAGEAPEDLASWALQAAREWADLERDELTRAGVFHRPEPTFAPVDNPGG